ncbi:hypothetical protein X737_36845 [Mesorhizobium sp. L48C026A00]|nr:hypothetical protein X737_36845 [Mesorhizobium sp. L48C026A00]
MLSIGPTTVFEFVAPAEGALAGARVKSKVMNRSPATAFLMCTAS